MNDNIIPIEEIVIMEDRARIKRKAKVKLVKGQTKFCIDGAAPILVDKTLNIYTAKQEKIKLLESRVIREYKIQNKNLPDDYSRVEKEIMEIRQNIQDQNSEIDGCRHEYTLLQQTLDLSFYELPIDVRRGVVPGETIEKELAAAQTRLINQQKKIVKLEREANELKQDLEQRTLLLSTLQNPSTFLDCSIVFELMCNEAQETEIFIEYIVPSVLWRPSYRADLSGKKLTFESQGCVWQNTGEDWNNVKLFFSTQRSSLGIDPPELDDDIISIEKKAKEQVVEIREETVENAGLGQSKRKPEDLPGIDDGGDALLIPALNRISVPSNGRPYKVITGTSEADVETGLVAIPELSSYVFFRTTQTNNANLPVLAGTVDLIRDNAYIGKTSLLFISPGEKFQLAWGPDPELRLQRSQYEKRKKKTFGNWEEIIYHTTLYISNIGSAKKQIKVQERIPVSEVESVKISLDTEAADKKTGKPDEKGMIFRNLTLKPYGHEKIEYSYIMKKAKKVSGI